MRKPARSVLSWIGAAMAASADGFIDSWTRDRRGDGALQAYPRRE